MLVATPSVRWLAGYAWFVWSTTGGDLPKELPGEKLCDYRRDVRTGCLLLTLVPYLPTRGVLHMTAPLDTPRLPEGLDAEPYIPPCRLVLDDLDLTLLAWSPIRLIDRDVRHEAWVYLQVRP